MKFSIPIFFGVLAIIEFVGVVRAATTTAPRPTTTAPRSSRTTLRPTTAATRFTTTAPRSTSAAMLPTTIAPPATNRTACPYTTLIRQRMDLIWYPQIDRGQEYIDYGLNTTNVCLQRAICANNVTYDTQIEKCSDFNVGCDNQLTFQGEFPACCVRC